MSEDRFHEELRCLDLRLRREIRRQRRRPRQKDVLASFLASSDAEPASGDVAPDSDEPAERDLTASLRDLERRIHDRLSGGRSPIGRLADIFRLSRFEVGCLVVALAPELERKYGTLYAYLQDDAARTLPRADLILSLLCDNPSERLAARAALDPTSPLLRFKLLQPADRETDPPLPLLARSFTVDPRIANFLLSVRRLDSNVQRFACLTPTRHAGEAGGSALAEQAVRFVHGYFREAPSRDCSLSIYLYGPSSADKLQVAETVAAAYELPLLIADAQSMQRGALPFEHAVWLLARDAALESAVLVLDGAECLLDGNDKRPNMKSLLDATRTFSRLTFVFGSRPWNAPDTGPDCACISMPAPPPELRECSRHWREALTARGAGADELDPDVLAGRFPFGRRQVEAAISRAENLARWRSPDDRKITARDVFAACRAQSSADTGTLVRKIAPKHTWADIVLPDDNVAQLRELCLQARYRSLVYGEWGFDRKLSSGKGLNALFSGPPGTGKTMAVEVIANELELDIHRVDLSQVVSKYIGETEKNLRHVFEEAQAGHAILFFDEADALFGKRSAVKDAHDRYANIEVGYLLQKLEEYEGIAILATNLSQHVDDAFLRRMQFIVEFPFPDSEHRGRIWKVVFPEETPVAPDVDFDLLAREVKLAGGNIKNIALAAAFHAASNGRVIQMGHLWQAARREHQKLGRSWHQPEVSSSRS